MSDTVRVSGITVPAAGVYRRSVPQANGGRPLKQVELAILLRGRIANRDLVAALQRGVVLLEAPGRPAIEAQVAAASVQASGSGEAAVHSYDLTLIELPASAVRRAAAAAATASPPASPAPRPAAAPAEEEAAANVASAGGSAPAAIWATALRQLGRGQAAAPPERPLTAQERATLAAVLAGLRIEALVGDLERAGLLPAGAAEAAFRRLAQERLVGEAAPLVGEAVARRALRQVVERS